MKLAPIVLFVFNRPEHTRKALLSLKANKLASESKLYIYADGPKPNASAETRENIEKVRQVIREQQWCGEVELIEAEHNIGCADSIIAGITKTLNKYERIIIIEDDLLVHPDFLIYMNEALERYEKEPEVFTVTGYQYPATFPASIPPMFFFGIASSWTWGTWKRAWDQFDPLATGWSEMKTNHALRSRFNFDNSNDFYKVLVQQMETHEIDAWDIRWYWTTFKLGGLHLYPRESLVENIGFDGSGVHKVDNDVNFSPMVEGPYRAVFPLQIKIDKNATQYLIDFWKLYYHHDITTRVKRRLIKIFDKK